MTRSLLVAASVAAVLIAAPAIADEKQDAQALVREAFQHVYDGEHAIALDKFKQAYAIYPSPKILLNMGTTLKKLGRYAEAADVYEKYLNHPEADPERTAEVKRELADADANVAVLRIEVNVDDARIILDGKPLTGLRSPITMRVDTGSHTIVAERDGYQRHTATIYDVKAREQRTVPIELMSLGDIAARKQREKKAAFDLGQSAAMSVIEKNKVATGGRIGTRIGAIVAVQEPGVSAVVGGSYGLTDRLDVELSGIIGGDQGGYAGGRFYLTTGRVRPTVGLGVPVFFVDGVRPGVRGTAGLVWLMTKTFGVSLDLGGERFFSAPAGYEKTIFVSTIGIEVRR